MSQDVTCRRNAPLTSGLGAGGAAGISNDVLPYVGSRYCTATFCNLGQATAAFAWLGWIALLGLLGLALFGKFCNQRRATSRGIPSLDRDFRQALERNVHFLLTLYKPQTSSTTPPRTRKHGGKDLPLTAPLERPRERPLLPREPLR